MKVSELMTRSVQPCSTRDNLARAAQTMWENDCGCVPIVDDGARVVGMLTDRDICMAGYMQGRVYSEIPVANVMARTVFTVREHDLVEAAEALMRDKQIRRLPVVDGSSKLRGILSLNDIARNARRTFLWRANGLSGDTIAQTLAGIGEPRGQLATRPSSARS